MAQQNEAWVSGLTLRKLESARSLIGKTIRVENCGGGVEEFEVKRIDEAGQRVYLYDSLASARDYRTWLGRDTKFDLLIKIEEAPQGLGEELVSLQVAVPKSLLIDGIERIRRGVSSLDGLGALGLVLAGAAVGQFSQENSPIDQALRVLRGER
jgi:hypothetical protein